VFFMKELIRRRPKVSVACEAVLVMHAEWVQQKCSNVTSRESKGRWLKRKHPLYFAGEIMRPSI
jgi:hypothetical protein